MAHLFCLPDYLTFMATGCLNRSVSCLVCKWGFESETNTWSSDFWRLGGLKDADFDELISKCGGGHGKSFNLAGSKISTGISRNAAIAFGFPALEGVAVGVALVDNFAGALA